jgi:hypothetical protein
MVTALLAGFFGVFATVVGAFVTQRWQRTAAQEERIWNRQAETYVLLLQHHGSGMVDENIEYATAREWAIRDELTARAKAFASDEVLSLWQESARANRRLDDYAGENWPELTVVGADWQAIEDASEKDPELRRLRQVSEQASKRLAAKVRAELDASRHRGRSQRGQRSSQDNSPTSVTGEPTAKLPLPGPETMAEPLLETPPGQLQ